MQSLLLFNSDEQPFAVEAIQRIFQSESGFQEHRGAADGHGQRSGKLMVDHPL